MKPRSGGSTLSGRRVGRLSPVPVLLCLAALTWPGHLLVGSLAATRPLGLPFWLLWNIGWLLATVFAMLLYHHATRRRSSDEGGRCR